MSNGQRRQSGRRTQPIAHPTSQALALGVVLERRDLDNPWQSHGWYAVGVMPGAPEIEAPRLLRTGEGWAQYHAATLPVTLYRRETEGYKRNLANQTPVVYVVLRDDDDGETDGDAPRPDLVTVCPYEAQDYLDAGAIGEQLEAVPMPDAVKAWVQAFVDEHHVDEPFKKRKRRKWAAEAPGADSPAHRSARHPGPVRRG